VTRSARLLLVSLLAACCLTLIGCEALDSVGFFGDLPEDTDLSDDPDVEVQAASAANQTILDEKAAQASLETALSHNDLSAAEDAVELRPLDPRYHIYLGALMLANGDSPNAVEEMSKADDIFNSSELDLKTRYHFALEALLRTRESFEKGSAEWERVNESYCYGLRTYTQVTADSSSNVIESIFNVATFPGDSCGSP
jgi:tetratricopeptide (TPR) repeat protein